MLVLKKLFFFAFLFLCFTYLSAIKAFPKHSYKQEDKNYLLKGVWLSGKQNYLSIDDSVLKSKQSERNLLGNEKYEEIVAGLKIIKDTLVFYSPKTYWSDDDLPISYENKKIKFLLVNVTEFDLTLKPLSDAATIFFNTKEELTFTRRDKLIDESFVFEKIVFNCFYGVEYLVEVDGSGNYTISGPFKETDYFIDKGKLSQGELEKLISHLKTAQLKKIKFPEITCCTSPHIRLDAYANNQKKSFDSMHPTYIVNDLIEYLWFIYKKNTHGSRN